MPFNKLPCSVKRSLLPKDIPPSTPHAISDFLIFYDSLYFPFHHSAYFRDITSLKRWIEHVFLNYTSFHIINIYYEHECFILSLNIPARRVCINLQELLSVEFHLNSCQYMFFDFTPLWSLKKRLSKSRGLSPKPATLQSMTQSRTRCATRVNS